MLEVKSDWQALDNSLPGPTKEDYFARRKKLQQLLRKRLSRADMDSLADTCGSLPLDEGSWDAFSRCVMELALDSFVASKDREKLVSLLSTRCPSQHDGMDIEEYLVRRGEKLEDPVLILGEAYSQCQVPDVRRVIAKATRRGFRGFGIRGDNDSEFVERAMKWYEREKGQLVINLDYGRNRDRDAYYKNPLFKWKSPAAASRSMAQGKDRKPASPIAPKALKEVTNSIGMKLALIPAGEFMMGSPEDEKGRRDNETPQHPVRITKPFWLGIYEVTLAEYERVMGYQKLGFPRSDDYSDVVNHVSWYQATEFCNRLSEEEGLPAYYRLSPSKRGEIWRDVEVLGGPGYRLSTEAEWEYACRAGTTTAFSFGESISRDQANFGGVGGHPANKGSYQANAFGLYDMHGNMAEWCHDVYDPHYYEDSPVVDPPGPSAADPTRHWVVVRGGYWCGHAEEARSAYRMDESPWVRKSHIGFRIARDDTGDWEERLRRVAARKAATTLTGHTAAVTAVAFSPDGKTLASASEDRTIKLWDLATASGIITLEGHGHRVLSVAFSPDGTTLASGSEDCTAKLWNAATGDNIRTLRGHTFGVTSVAYSPDGKTLASGSLDETIKLWDPPTGAETAVLKGHTWVVRYSSHGMILASASHNTIKLWDTATYHSTTALEANVAGYAGDVLCLAFSQDGKILASATGTPFVRLWDVATGKNTVTLRQKSGNIKCIDFSPDGKTLASASSYGDKQKEERAVSVVDTTIRLWDLATGTDMVVRRGRPSGFRVVAFSPDGQTLAAGGLDGKIMLIRPPWNTDR